MFCILSVTIYIVENENDYNDSFLFSLLFQYGLTALIWASEMGHLDIVRTLLRNKADKEAEADVRNLMLIMMMTVSMVVTMIIWWLLLMIMMIVDDDDNEI